MKRRTALDLEKMKKITENKEEEEESTDSTLKLSKERGGRGVRRGREGGVAEKEQEDSSPLVLDKDIKSKKMRKSNRRRA